MMDNKRGKNVISMATKLDAMTNSDGEIAKLGISMVEKDDDSSTLELCKRISDFANSDNRQTVQIAQALKDSIVNYYGYIRVCKICNMNQKEHTDEREKSLSELLDELNALIGLKNVKTIVNDLITYQKVQQLRQKEGLYAQKKTLHMAFTGNPGTGKTTVARIVGHVYKQIGLLSKGHFIEVSRTDLIAGYQGQTALKVKEVIERAKGGVLFIDEAYSITENDHTDSYGRECLTELTKALEDYREDLVVIVAGYSKPMQQFFESNPGLRSRFNTFIEFDDYSADELLEILGTIAQKNDYMLSDALNSTIRSYFKEKIKDKQENFSNGRLARNIYDDLVMAHAKRIVEKNNPTCDELSLLLPEDFKAYIKKYGNGEVVKKIEYDQQD
ncbi:MAG: AAA family ATPase [Prevotella sp.]|nr:AAA family ATPase [Prevotella sp.]